MHSLSARAQRGECFVRGLPAVRWKKETLERLQISADWTSWDWVHAEPAGHPPPLLLIPHPDLTNRYPPYLHKKSLILSLCMTEMWTTWNQQTFDRGWMKEKLTALYEQRQKRLQTAAGELTANMFLIPVQQSWTQLEKFTQIYFASMSKSINRGNATEINEISFKTWSS